MKKFKMSFFDITIIGIVIVVAMGVLGLYYTKQKKNAATASTIKYVLELNDNPIGFSKLIKVGDKLTDNVKNYYMGKVAGVEVVPNMKVVGDSVNGRMVETELTSKEKVLVTVETTVNDKGSDLLIDGLYDVRVGKEVYLKGDGYAGVGYIIKVER